MLEAVALVICLTVWVNLASNGLTILLAGTTASMSEWEKKIYCLPEFLNNRILDEWK